MTMERVLWFWLLCLSFASFAQGLYVKPSKNKENQRVVLKYFNQKQDWNEDLLKTDSKQYQAMVKENKDMLKNHLPSLLVDIENPKFTRKDGKVLTDVTLVVKNPDLIDSMVEKIRTRRFDPFAYILEALKGIQGFGDVTAQSTGKLLDSCQKTSECSNKVSNSYCEPTNSICDCAVGYVRDGQKCYYAVPVDQICEVAAQCNKETQECKVDPKNAAQKKCQCKSGTYHVTGTQDCFPYAKAPDYHCTVAKQCEQLANQECNFGKCSCKTGYSKQGDTCKPTPTLPVPPPPSTAAPPTPPPVATPPATVPPPSSPEITCPPNSLGSGSCSDKCPCTVANSQCSGAARLCHCKTGFVKNGNACDKSG